MQSSQLRAPPPQPIWQMPLRALLPALLRRTPGRHLRPPDLLPRTTGRHLRRHHPVFLRHATSRHLRRPRLLLPTLATKKAS